MCVVCRVRCRYTVVACRWWTRSFTSLIQSTILTLHFDSNCVGIGNHKYFLLFVFYTFLTCMYSLILIITRFTTCFGEGKHLTVGRHHHHIPCLDHPTQLLVILGLLIESLLFGMFTSCMMFDQMDVIVSKVTHIDKLKGAEVGGSLSGLAEVFGVVQGQSTDRFRLDWLSPFRKVCIPTTQLYEEMMGFCQQKKEPVTLDSVL